MRPRLKSWASPEAHGTVVFLSEGRDMPLGMGIREKIVLRPRHNFAKSRLDPEPVLILQQRTVMQLMSRNDVGEGANADLKFVGDAAPKPGFRV